MVSNKTLRSSVRGPFIPDTMLPPLAIGKLFALWFEQSMSAILFTFRRKHRQNTGAEFMGSGAAWLYAHHPGRVYTVRPTLILNTRTLAHGHSSIRGSTGWRSLQTKNIPYTVLKTIYLGALI